MKHPFLDGLDDAPDTLLDLCQFGLPSGAVGAALVVQAIGLLGIALLWQK
ncbi:hypothetical protein [Gluconobacter sp. P1D12_c]|nr:hypothetical protein [Gluconobacter sp. P1D12_c]